MTGFLRRALAKLALSAPDFRGKHRVLRKADALLRVGEVTTTVGGARFRLNTADLIDFYLLYDGTYGRPVLEHLRRRIGRAPGPLWDIGANVGAVALPLLTEFPDLHASLFEPSPLVLPRLLGNLQANAELWDRVKVFGLPLSDHASAEPFYFSAESWNSGVGNLARTCNVVGELPVVTHTTTVDRILDSGEPPPRHIKIDVEGFEFEVFEGMRSYLARGSAVDIVFEHSQYRLREREQSPFLSFDLLKSLGFELAALGSDGRLEAITRDALDAFDGDLAATRPSSR